MVFPKRLLTEFETRILKEQICWNQENSNLKRYRTCFRTAQKVSEQIALPPTEWSDNRNSIYLYFISNNYSVDYATKVIKLMNLWGRFYSKKTNSFFENVPPPQGEASIRIREAFYKKKPRGREVLPLTLELLNKAKDRMIRPHWNWMFLSLWFGLRPSELMNLQWKVEVYKGRVLFAVFQRKLSRLAPEKRWKFIPVLFEEQKLGLEIIRSGDYRPPMYKTLLRCFGKGYGLRSGRKGFVALMWDKGKYSKEITYRWLGHKSIRMTVDHYTQGIQQACEF